MAELFNISIPQPEEMKRGSGFWNPERNSYRVGQERESNGVGSKNMVGPSGLLREMPCWGYSWLNPTRSQKGKNPLT